MAKKPNATREFRTASATKRPARSANGKRTQTSVAYRTARIARARQKREIEQQKREKLIFALFVVVVLVMIIFAILLFKKFLGNDTEGSINDSITPNNDSSVVSTQTGDDPISTSDVEEYTAVMVSSSAVFDGPLLTETASIKAPVISDSTYPLIANTRTAFGTSNSGNTIYAYYTAKRFEDRLEKNALDAFNKLADAFYEATKSLSNDLYISKPYANDGSVYTLGTSIDLKMWLGGENYFYLSDSKYETEYNWIKENAYKYGFIITADTDKQFSIRYVGVPHAEYMTKNGMTLEQYTKYVKNGEISISTESGDGYRVFYAKVSGEYSEIQIPSGCEHSISGNNSDGVIVTVKTK